jgi:hypothetical protein
MKVIATATVIVGAFVVVKLKAKFVADYKRCKFTRKPGVSVGEPPRQSKKSCFSKSVLLMDGEDMEDDTIFNPWIEVPKRKRHRTFNQNDPSQPTISSKSEVDKLQRNSFINLTLQESRPEDSTSNGIEMTVEHLPPSPGFTSPPRKRSKKDPTKVWHGLWLC